jgi:hypothetical protein
MYKRFDCHLYLDQHPYIEIVILLGLYCGSFNLLCTHVTQFWEG